MFYSQLVLAKKGALGKIWLAAHMEKNVSKLSIIQTNIPESVENIENPTVPMALRVSGHLLLGVVRIFSRKVTYLLTDCSDALVKIKDAFRTGSNELAPGAGTKNFDEITKQDQLDDMDLDVDLTDPATLFNAEDGIELPDGLAGIELPDPDNDEAGIRLPIERALEPDGFGAHEDFTDFFPEAKRMHTEDDVEHDEDELEREGLTRASKQRRTSGNQPEDEEEEVDEAFEEAGVSRLRSATNGDPMGGIAVGGDGFEDDFMRNPVLEEEDDRVPSGLEEEEELPDVELPLQEDEEEDDEEKDDEEKDDEDEDEEPTGLAAVMMDPQARGKKSRTAPADSQLKQLSKARKAPPKGELIIDKETQLSPAYLHKQLVDTSAIVRDFTAEAAAEVAKSGKSRFGRARADQYDPLVDAPRMSYLPSNVASMPCFMPRGKVPALAANKRMRLSDGSQGAAPTGHVAEVFGDGDDLPEVLRREEQTTHGGLAIDPTLDPTKEHAAMMEQEEEELSGAHMHMEEDEQRFDQPLPEEEEEEVGIHRRVSSASSVYQPASEDDDAEPQPAGFDPAQALPNVNVTEKPDADDDEAGKRSASQSAPTGSHDPSAWNQRTRMMLQVLKTAFDKSDGESLSYNAMVASTPKSTDKRKVVAGCFQELLFLTTHGIIELQQQKAYGNILISKTELFAETCA